MYEPHDDSYLLREAVLKLKPKGKVLDMGTGSGIQGLAAMKTSKEVLAVDKDEEAVAHAKSKGLNAIHSSYFSNVKGKFDLIICNPPYLPNDKRVKNIALDGGEQGWEWSDNFLQDAKQYLNPEGKILILFSSHTKKEAMIELFTKYGYEFKEFSKKKIDFETLYVYELTNTLWNYLAEGKRNYVQECNNKVRKFTKQGKKDTLDNEAEMLKEVNSKGIGPQKLVYADGMLVMEKVCGLSYEEWVKKGKLKNFPAIVDSLLDQARTLDKMLIDKSEFTRPYANIKIDGKRVILLDFERARKNPKPKNVAQLSSFFQNKLRIDLKLLTKRYVKSYSDKDFGALKKIIMRKVSFKKDYFKVWELLREVPKGSTTTYKELANKAGIKSYRFVGRIMNQNPFAPIVPCHRCLASNGIGGFATGIEHKKELLRKEGVKL